MTTPSQTVGPFFSIGLDWMGPDQGEIQIAGIVFDGAGDPVPDSVVEIWHPDPPRFGRCLAGDGGEFHFEVDKPHAIQAHAPHFDVSVFARGLLKRVVTRIYFPDEPEANSSDPVLALVDDRDALVAADEGHGRLRFDIHLQGDRQTPFFEL